MQVKIFNVPIDDSGEMLSELNKFLSVNRVLEVISQFYMNDNSACWCFCVKYIQSIVPTQPQQVNKIKTDYKQVLSETEFAVFSKLRECRKAMATEDGIPAFAIFTDEELAGMARLQEITTSSMKSVTGIGDKKTARYGDRMMTLMKKGK